MYGAINGSYILFNGLNAAGGEAVNGASVTYAEENDQLSATATLPVVCAFTQTEENDTLSSGVTLPVVCDVAYQQEDQAITALMDVIINASFDYQQLDDTLFAFCENTTVRKVLGSSLTAHNDGSNLTRHTVGSEIEDIH